MAQDASLAEQYPELASLVAKNEAEAEKEKGNRAFSEKRSVSAPSPRPGEGKRLHAQGCTIQPAVMAMCPSISIMHRTALCLCHVLESVMP